MHEHTSGGAHSQGVPASPPAGLRCRGGALDDSWDALPSPNGKKRGRARAAAAEE